MSTEVSRNDRVMVLQTLYACIEDYREFDTSYCKDALSSLRVDNLDLLDSPAPPVELPDSDGDLSSGEFVFYDYENNEEARVYPVNVYAGAEFLPHPAYEICTPASRNIKVGDDPDQMPYLPFADDPTFDYGPYNNEHGYLSWQHEHLDPEFEIIAIEAVQRLLLQGMDSSKVEAMGLFPPRVRGSFGPAVPRLGRLIHRRDFPKPLPDEWEHLMQISPPYLNAGPSDVLQSLMAAFCHNPNCLTGYCSVHLGRIPPPIPQTLSISTESLAIPAEKACGRDCFVVPTNLRDINSAAVWSSADKELLHTVLGYSQDALPCDLAVICRKPCFEVARYRTEYLNTSRPANERAAKRRHAKKTTRNFKEDNNASEFKPNRAAILALATQLPTVNASKTMLIAHPIVVAIGNVLASGKGAVVQRRGGYATRKHVRVAARFASVIHECAKSARPLVDPEISAPGEKKSICCNMALQLGLSKKSMVHRSRYGLGLFIMEDAREGDLISEYTGELIHEDTTTSRDHIARKNGRTYLFDLNSRLSVDSSTVGNEARYINHDTVHYNCEATIRNVNGEHRIGFFATKPIRTGSEILINYGPEFFKERKMNDVPRLLTGISSTPGKTEQSAGGPGEDPVEDGNPSDTSYQPSQTHSGSSSTSQLSTVIAID
ncbi:hypothetical protein NMY22_g1340 [Coprinellus aureogranulatus]|nr:hypothetical protein NMY22_g1340 [Coprinellus aureogranulatus]